MAATANTFASATWELDSKASASAIAKSAKSGVGVSDDDGQLCVAARIELGGRLANRIALQIHSLDTGIVIGEDGDPEHFHGDDVVLTQNNKWIATELGYDTIVVWHGDGIEPGTVADGNLTYTELNFSMIRYFQGMSCGAIRELVVADAGLATIGLAGAGVGIGTVFGALVIGADRGHWWYPVDVEGTL